MTKSVLVASKALGTILEVPGQGMTPVDVLRSAANTARGLHRIPDPIALTEDHKSATVVRAIAEQKFREQVAAMMALPLNGSGTPFWRQPESTRYRH